MHATSDVGRQSYIIWHWTKGKDKKVIESNFKGLPQIFLGDDENSCRGCDSRLPTTTEAADGKSLVCLPRPTKSLFWIACQCADVNDSSVLFFLLFVSVSILHLLASFNRCKKPTLVSTRISLTARSACRGDNAEADGLWAPRDPPHYCTLRRRTDPRTRSTTHKFYTGPP